MPPGAASRALLRACGGISIRLRITHVDGTSSPRVRRYFRAQRLHRAFERLFSARAEVFPWTTLHAMTWLPLLHACGGISKYGRSKEFLMASSPRVRRYFHQRLSCGWGNPLFSARAEVFPFAPVSSQVIVTLLRACGGISSFGFFRHAKQVSSPRVRRYFLQGQARRPQLTLFSARAEVFPFLEAANADVLTLLRACGGISLKEMYGVTNDCSSPRVRRYFRG